jgi:hypothetical protein
MIRSAYEDPIEYVFEDNQCVIEQREVGLDTLSFAHALKHVLRQDPDVIMIGEIRDSISFTAAMSAADIKATCAKAIGYPWKPLRMAACRSAGGLCAFQRSVIPFAQEPSCSKES